VSTRNSLGLSDQHAGGDAATSHDDGLLTVHDAARLLNVSVSWVYEHTRVGVDDDRLPFVKLGKYLRFDRADLRAYIDAKRAAARTTRRTR
jgi:excisionase family DNA binding protein